MTNYLKIGFLLLLPVFTDAQPVAAIHEPGNPDSLRHILLNATNDSVRYEACRQLYYYYEESNRDSAFYYAEQRLLLAKRNNKKIVEASSLGVKGYQLIYLGRFGEALASLLEAFKIAEEPKNDEPDTWRLTGYNSPGKSRLITLSMLHHMLGHLMLQTENIDQHLIHVKEGRRIALSIDNKFRILVADMVLASSYMAINKPDSALLFAKEGEQVINDAGIKKYEGYIFFVMGDVYLSQGNKPIAEQYYHKALQSSTKNNNLSNVAGSYSRLINYYLKEGEKDAALAYALKNLQTVKSLGKVTAAAAQDINIGTAYEQVYLGYKLKKQFDSAFKYQGLALIAKDSINKIRTKNLADFQNLTLNEQFRLQNLEKEKVVYQSKIRTYTLLAGIGVVMLIAFLLYRNTRNRQKANVVLQQQKQELQSTLSELKSTQSQLIQSEKMASLGELTAGIAHEIQNPLNFVNNFSEVNKELLLEMKDELHNGNIADANTIANSVIDNEEKINHHGKRADAIVKGMLQHSRSSSGQKESTDINALADEYLRLAYHGLRAKDKSFNASLETDYDESIGNISIIPQDIGRVILNLINNAFYAASLPSKGGFSDSDKNDNPIVWVSTKKVGNQVLISVRDNGPGIPRKIIDKIFQPFFTTKPTGQGTGLGLSLSYDIVKAHGGELKVETKEGEGSEFIIQLPA